MTLSYWWQDARRAVRFLGRHPLFAVGVILVLAIGIGPVTAFVSLMNVTFLRPWPVPDPDRLTIFRARPVAGEAYGEISGLRTRRSETSASTTGPGIRFACARPT